MKRLIVVLAIGASALAGCADTGNETNAHRVCTSPVYGGQWIDQYGAPCIYSGGQWAPRNDSGTRRVTSTAKPPAAKPPAAKPAAPKAPAPKAPARKK